MKQLKKRFRDGSLSDEPVATLEGLLLAGKGRLLFKPDLKPGILEHFDELARLITRLEMTDQVFVRTSWKDAETIEKLFASGTPRVEIMFKVKTAAQVKAAHERFSPRTIQIDVAKGESLSPQKREAIQMARDLGILVETHSYGDAAQWKELIEAGVRMFHTAVPDKTLDYLIENGWREGIPQP